MLYLQIIFSGQMALPRAVQTIFWTQGLARSLDMMDKMGRLPAKGLTGMSNGVLLEKTLLMLNTQTPLDMT